MGAITVGIVCKHRLVREALWSLLLSMSIGNVSRVLSGESVEIAQKEIAAAKAQIVLIDGEYCNNCLKTLREIRGLSPSTKCLVLLSSPDEVSAVKIARGGAWGIVPKEADPKELRRAIEKLAADEMFFSGPTLAKAIQASLHSKQAEDSPLEHLTPREAEILNLLAKGYANKEIATHLVLADSTVRKYTESIYRKLRVTSRLQAVMALMNKWPDQRSRPVVLG